MPMDQYLTEVIRVETTKARRRCRICKTSIPKGINILVEMKYDTIHRHRVKINYCPSHAQIRLEEIIDHVLAIQKRLRQV